MSEKTNPKDIDVVLFFDAMESEKKKDSIKILVETISHLYKVDAFVAWSPNTNVNISKKNLKIISQKRRYWRRYFGKDKTNNRRDIIKINSTELIKVSKS